MAEIHGPKIVRDDLILNLDAADINSYPGSGTTWYDLSGRVNNATLVNGPTVSNRAIVLDGTNDLVTAPPVNTLGAIPNHAFEIWVKTPGLGSGKTVGGLICPDYGMISHITGNGNITYFLYNTDASPYQTLVSLGTSGVNMFDNNWHHVVCTRNPGNASIYVDGVVRATTSGGIATWSGATIWSSMNTQIGNNPNDQYYNLYGNIASAKIYRKYLTAQEVLQNYNATKTRFGL
jgi:hypothetical protein